MRNNICLDFGSIYDPFLLRYVSSWFKSEELKIAQELGKSSGAEEQRGRGGLFKHPA